MNVRIVVVGRVGVCMLCVDDSEESERGVGVGVTGIMMSETFGVPTDEPTDRSNGGHLTDDRLNRMSVGFVLT